MVVDPVVATMLSAAATGIAAAMGTAVKMLWSRVEAQSLSTEKALEECREEHRATSEKFSTVIDRVATLAQTVDILKNSQGGK